MGDPHVLSALTRKPAVIAGELAKAGNAAKRFANNGRRAAGRTAAEFGRGGRRFRWEDHREFWPSLLRSRAALPRGAVAARPGLGARLAHGAARSRPRRGFRPFPITHICPDKPAISSRNLFVQNCFLDAECRLLAQPRPSAPSVSRPAHHRITDHRTARPIGHPVSTEPAELTTW